MPRVALAVALLLAVSPAIAQTSAPLAPAQAAPERPRLSDAQRAKLRADRDACRAEVRRQDLPRGERRGAMRRCVEALNPDLKPLFARGEARRAEMRQLRDACRTDIRAKAANSPMPRGEELRRAMRACLVERRPALAKVFGCIDQARARNLQPGDERREFMRTCLRA